MSTLSANRTRLGLDLSLAFLAADSKADFRVEDWKIRREKMLSKLLIDKYRMTFVMFVGNTLLRQTIQFGVYNYFAFSHGNIRL